MQLALPLLLLALEIVVEAFGIVKANVLAVVVVNVRTAKQILDLCF